MVTGLHPATFQDRDVALHSPLIGGSIVNYRTKGSVLVYGVLYQELTKIRDIYL